MEGKRSSGNLSSFPSLSVVWSGSTTWLTSEDESFSGGGWWWGSAEKWRRREEGFGVVVWGLRKQRRFECFGDALRAALIFSVSSQRKSYVFSLSFTIKRETSIL